MDIFTKTLIVIGVTSIAAMFIFLGGTSSSQTASAQSCLPVEDQGSFDVTWPNTSTRPGIATVQAKGPLCKDAILWFSSYTLPVNYDNSGVFGGPTSYPQKVHASTKIVIPKGSTTKQTVRVAEPDACETARQFDIYRRDEEITEIKTSDGIFEYSDVDWAWGFVYNKLGGESCKKPEEPKPEILRVCRLTDSTIVEIDKAMYDDKKHTTVLETCTAPVKLPEQPNSTPTETPVELPKTGLGSTLTSIGILGLLTGTIAVYIQSRRA